jgi:hypothetical protein
MYTIHIPMEAGAETLLLYPDGNSRGIGRVVAVPTASRHPGFTASKYGIGGQVIATAANAHHIQISVENGTGRTMSILPARTFANASGLGTSFVINGVGGAGIWGEFAPFVGSPVYIVNQVGVPVLFNNPRLFQYAAALQIRVYRPESEIEYFEIENVRGGKAWYRDAEGYHQFAVVESEVSGTGRFEGTLYQGQGYVRANHPGVICVSTCPKFEMGGFQIVPLSHTYSGEMQKTRNMNQYIVLRGMNFEDLTGQAPFFEGWVRPGDTEAPERNTGRVICRVNGSWQEMPNILGLSEHTLEDVEAFRIYL